MKITDKLCDINFSHHDANLCVCDSCNCGRHLCKLHVVKPDLKNFTNYQKSFLKPKFIPNIIP
jgi:hypothetical protein